MVGARYRVCFTGCCGAETSTDSTSAGKYPMPSSARASRRLSTTESAGRGGAQALRRDATLRRVPALGRLRKIPPGPASRAKRSRPGRRPASPWATTGTGRIRGGRDQLACHQTFCDRRLSGRGGGHRSGVTVRRTVATRRMRPRSPLMISGCVDGTSAAPNSTPTADAAPMRTATISITFVMRPM